MILGPRLMLGICSLCCARVLHDTLLMPVLMYGSETMIWKEKEMSKIRAVQIDNFRGFLGIKEWIEYRMYG